MASWGLCAETLPMSILLAPIAVPLLAVGTAKSNRGRLTGDEGDLTED